MPKKRPTTRQKYGKPERAPDNRPSASRRGYGVTHRRWRLMVLHRHPVCTMCKRAPATVADHIVPWQDGGAKYALSNGTGNCSACHNRKTAQDIARRRQKG